MPAVPLRGQRREAALPRFMIVRPHYPHLPMNTSKDATHEASLPKALSFSAGYFALLLPSLTFAVNIYADSADPPVVNQNVDHWLLLSGFGGWLWFGTAFTLPAFVLIAISCLLRRVWKALKKDSHVLA